MCILPAPLHGILHKLKQPNTGRTSKHKKTHFPDTNKCGLILPITPCMQRSGKNVHQVSLACIIQGGGSVPKLILHSTVRFRYLEDLCTPFPNTIHKN